MAKVINCRTEIHRDHWIGRTTWTAAIIPNDEHIAYPYYPFTHNVILEHGFSTRKAAQVWIDDVIANPHKYLRKANYKYGGYILPIDES